MVHRWSQMTILRALGEQKVLLPFSRVLARAFQCDIVRVHPMTFGNDMAKNHPKSGTKSKNFNFFTPQYYAIASTHELHFYPLSRYEKFGGCLS